MVIEQTAISSLSSKRGPDLADAASGLLLHNFMKHAVPRDKTCRFPIVSRMLHWIVAILLTLQFVGPAAAQEWNLFSPCRDVGFSAHEIRVREAFDQCDPQALRKLHAQFASPPLEQLAGAGGQAVRVTVTDGYGNRVVAVEAVRRERDGPSRAIARGQGDGTRRAHEVMEAALDLDAWDAIARRALDRANAPALLPLPVWRDPATIPDDEGVICLHGWSVVIETFGFGSPRVLARNSCDRSEDVETYELGWRVVQHVFAAFPACGWLDRQYYRNDADRLGFCLGLSGEAHVAASATNAARPYVDGTFVSDRLRLVLADDFTLTLPGEAAVSGADAAFARWRAYVAAGDYSMGFDVASGAIGDRWEERAIVEMLLFDETWRDWERSARIAEVTQTWRRDEDGFWLLTAMTIGPMHVVQLPEE